MTDQASYPREWIAQHEAGHAVARAAIGMGFLGVTIEDDPPCVWPIPGARVWSGGAMLAAAAGGIADAQLRGLVLPDDQVAALLLGSPDNRFTMLAADGSVACRPARPVGRGQDLAYMAGRAARDGWPELHCVLVWRQCEAFTAAIRPAIDAVAAALLERGHLPYAEVAALAERAMAGRPPVPVPEWAACPAAFLPDAPARFYALSDASTSAVAADSSGNSAPPLTQVTVAGSNPVTFAFGGAGMIGTGAFGASGSASIQAATWTYPSSGAVSGHTFLQGELSQDVTAAAGFTVECWYSFTNPGLSGAYKAVLFTVANSLGGVVIAYGELSGSDIAVTVVGLGGSLTATVPLSGQIALVVTSSAATLYLNGAQAATTAFFGSFTASLLTLGYIPNVYTSPAYTPWSGSLSCCAVYASALSSTRVAAHYSAGWTLNQGKLISALVSNVLAYAGMPSWAQSVDTGASYADAYEISGQTALSMLQIYQTVDGGVLFCSESGVLTWQDRTARYGAQVTPTLTLAAGQYEPGLTMTTNTQLEVNDVTNASQDVPAGVRAVSASSKTTGGTYASGSPSAPNPGNWYTSPAHPSTGIPAADVLADAGNWQVNTAGFPVPRASGLVIDLLTGDPALTRAAAWAAVIGTVVELAGLPSTGPGGTRANCFMVEGITETFVGGATPSWTLELATSPASLSAAWIAGDAALGVLDSTAVTGRGSDGAAGGSGRYVGPPYPVPTFSSTMNVTGNVGANNLRGLTETIRQQIYPPVAVAQQVSVAQSLAASTSTDVQWDTLWYDSAGGWDLSSSATAYTVQVAGIYEVLASIVFPPGSGTCRAWLQQNGNNSLGVPAAECKADASEPTALLVTATISCAYGDALKITAYQNSGSAVTLATTYGGCMLSILYRGQ